MKYLDMFKSWWFWVGFILIYILEIIINIRLFEYLFFAEYIGLAIGSLVITFVIASLFWAFFKFMKDLL